MRKFAIYSIFLAVLCLLLPAELLSTVLTVDHAGGGDFIGIQAAVDAATDYDTIEVWPGTYSGAISVTKRITILSSGGKEVTFIDGGGTTNHFIFDSAFLASLEGFTMTNGYAASGGASIRIEDGAVVAVHQCTFEDNDSFFHAGAIFTRDPGTNVYISSCEFTNNSSGNNGGAVTALLGSRVTLDECTFTGNLTDIQGGAVAANASAMNIYDCLFVGNRSNDVGGVVYFFQTEGTISGNTFVDNMSMGPVSASVFLQECTEAEFTRNILCGETNSYGLSYYDSPDQSHSCNIFWDNALGDINYGTIGSDEYSTDPLFCDPDGGDYTVSIHSKAAPTENVCGVLIGALSPVCDLAPPREAPEILTIDDIDGDNGYQVRIRWNKCAYDTLGSTTVITGYAIYRNQVTTQEVLDTSASPGGSRAFEKGTALDGWDYIATIPARGDAIYQYVAPTLCNYSEENGICWSEFFVSAMTADPMTYFDSDPASGYSEDDLPPAPPAGLAGEYPDGQSGIQLSWLQNEEEDLQCYRVYRGNDETFVPCPENLLGSPEAAGFHDVTYGSCEVWYKVAAIDVHGNVSGFALLRPAEITGEGGGDLPSTDFLAQNYPNPFNPSTIIEFGLRQTGHVDLRVYDVAGRLVRVLAARPYDAGVHTVDWNGTDDSGSSLASGIYIYRLKTGEFDRTKKMILLR